MYYTSLDQLNINRNAKIINLNCNNTLRRRLLDLGFVKGSSIKAVFKSPTGDPIAYEIKNTILALRKDDTKLINIILD